MTKNTFRYCPRQLLCNMQNQNFWKNWRNL